MALKVALPLSPAMVNLTNILKPLNIGRQRGASFQPMPPRRRLPPNRRRFRTPTPSPSRDHIVDPASFVTTQSSVDGKEAVTSTVASADKDKMVGIPDDKAGGGDHDHDDHDDHDHATDHDDFNCQPTSMRHMAEEEQEVSCEKHWLEHDDGGGQHSAYIRENLEMLQKKCKQFHECTKEVYSAENFHRILSGGDIQLKNICGLMYADGEGEGYTALNEHCSGSERRAIRQDIGDSLTTTLADPPSDSNQAAWRKLKRCLSHNARQNEEAIDTACRLKKGSTFLCEEHEVDRVTEEFFNHEMEHLHCSCKAITAEAANAGAGSGVLPLAARMAVAGGVLGLLLILIIVVVVLCCRHRRVKRELDKHRMQYLPSPHGEASAVYQEIGDRSQAVEALRRARDQGTLPSNYHFMDPAPALPDRYVKDLSGSKPNLAPPACGEAEYLEPLPEPRKGPRPTEAHANDAYNASQGSHGSGRSVYDLARHPGHTPPTARAAPPESDYFDRIQLNRAEEDDVGYSSLGRKYAERPDRGRKAGDASTAEETEPLNRTPAAEAEDGDVSSPAEPKYFVLESHKEDREALTTASANSVPV